MSTWMQRYREALTAEGMRPLFPWRAVFGTPMRLVGWSVAVLVAVSALAVTAAVIVGTVQAFTP